MSRSGRAALRPDRVAVRQFALVFALSFVLAVLGLFAPNLSPAGPGRRTLAIGLALVQLATFPIGIALAPWTVGAATGDGRASPLFAFRRCWGSIWWGLALNLLAFLPAMIGHYVLGLGAIGKAPGTAAAMLVVDAGLVGYLGVLIHASQVMVAERMANRVGETLNLNGSIAASAQSRVARGSDY